jgi:uroporphyrinogen decarboxylase
MNTRARFRGLINGTPIDRVPWLEEGLRDDVLTRWQGEGMPAAGPAAIFAYDRRARIAVDLQLRPEGARGLVTRAELPAWRTDLDRPLATRLAPDWPAQVPAWRQRDYLLELSVHSGLFLTMGVGDGAALEAFMYLLADEPQTVQEAMALQGELARRLTQRVLADIDVDLLSFSEPIGDNHGPLIGPGMYRTFALDTYQPILDLARHAGVPAIVFMTYANAHCLLPGVLEAGFNTLWAMETETPAMDYRRLRREFGSDLRLIGGIDLDALLAGAAAIEREMRAKVPELLTMGGCIPLADGRVRASVSWPAYVHYRRLLQQMTGNDAPR